MTPLEEVLSGRDERAAWQRRWLRSGAKRSTGTRTGTQARHCWQCGR